MSREEEEKERGSWENFDDRIFLFPTLPVTASDQKTLTGR